MKAARARNHGHDGPKADDALTINPDQPDLANHALREQPVWEEIERAPTFLCARKTFFPKASSDSELGRLWVHSHQQPVASFAAVVRDCRCGADDFRRIAASWLGWTQANPKFAGRSGKVMFSVTSQVPSGRQLICSGLGTVGHQVPLSSSSAAEAFHLAV